MKISKGNRLIWRAQRAIACRGIAAPLVVLCFPLVACTTATQITAKDGSPAQLIECRRAMSECHLKAQEVCGGKYIPLDDSRSSGVHGAWNKQGGAMGTSTRYELVVRCQ